jgi:predicted dehydrogenase
MKSNKLAQIGCGYWGPNLLRNFNSLKNCKVEMVIEPNKERQKFITESFPNIKVSENLSPAISDPSINAVIIATPAHLHFEQAKLSLQSGKHVFVEKPMATSESEVEQLIKLAEAKNLVLMSGHTFLYNDAVRFIKQQIDSGEIGDIRYIYSQRLNLGRIRSDVDALWNFAPHDISIIQYLLNDPTPLEINSHGMDFIQSGINDISFLNIKYDSCIANIHVSWLDPLKTRKLVVVGSKKMIVYDDVAEDKIIIYDKGIDKFSKLGENMDFDSPSSLTFKYRSGDIWVPKIDYREPLKTEAEHFLDCIITGKKPISGSTHTLQVIKILEEASKH